jgi:hypothetical protein
MPNLTGSLSRNLFVSQYIDDNGGIKVQFNALASNSTNYTTAVPWIINTAFNYKFNPLFQADSSFFSLFKAIGPGAVGELVINGVDETGAALVPSGEFIYLTNNTSVTIRPGTRIYWAVHSVFWYNPDNGQRQTNMLTFHQNLQAAIASANAITSQSSLTGNSATVGFESGDVMGIACNNFGYKNGTATTTAQISLGGWARLIQPGTTTVAQSTA